MTCEQQRLIESYLDGELSREERKEFAKHLNHCTACHTELSEHKRLAGWIDEMIAESLPPVPEEALDNIDVDAAWSRFQSRLVIRDRDVQPETATAQIAATPLFPSATQVTPNTQSNVQKRRWSFMAKSYQKWLVGTAAAVVVLGSLSLPQVQAAASDLLSQFRVEKFEAIHVTLQDMQDIQSWLDRGAVGERDLNGLGKIEKLTNSTGAKSFDTIELAKQAGYTAAPAPNGFTATSMEVSPETGMQFTLNTEKANSLLKSLGSNVQFEQNLNNKPFTVNIPQMTETRYTATDDSVTKLVYSVLKTPQMKAPEDVDLKQLRATILQLPFLPKNITQQLAGIEDWQTTVPVPYVDGAMEKVKVNGVEGVLGADNNDKNTVNSAILVWQKDGKLHRLQTQSTKPVADLKSNLLDIAKLYN